MHIIIFCVDIIMTYIYHVHLFRHYYFYSNCKQLQVPGYVSYFTLHHCTFPTVYTKLNMYRLSKNTAWLSSCMHLHTTQSIHILYAVRANVAHHVQFSWSEPYCAHVLNSRSTAAGSQEWHHSWWDTCPGLWPMCTKA